MSYLYNSADLQPLPDEIRAHPYKFIMSITSGDSVAYYAISCAEKPHTWVDSETYAEPLRYSTDGVVQMRQAIGSSAKWVMYPETEGRLNTPIGSSGSTASEDMYGNRKIIWSNHDIYHPDGTLLMAASYPINAETGEEVTEYGLNPVPVTTINPSVLMQGFFVGVGL